MKNITTNQNENQTPNGLVTRRTALLQSLGIVGTLLTAKTVFAQTASEAPPVCPPLPPFLVKVVESEISKNHGHEFTIELSELIKVGGHPLDIQGDSGHPHTITVTNDQIIALLKGENVVIVSSKDAGHTHNVTLTVVEREAQG